MMMEPVEFHENPETRDTNSYQKHDDVSDEVILARAIKEFRAFRDLLVAHGVTVTTVLGQKGCPDDIFCNNWVSTLSDRRMIFYPMLAPNRQKERNRTDVIAILNTMYDDVFDLSAHEKDGKFLESTGAMWLDKVHKIAYQGRSKRSYEDLAAKWCAHFGFEHVPFDTDYHGKPVYHTDVMMWIGTNLAGVCSESLKDRSLVDHLKKKREVVEFTNSQMEAFCGNSLEVIGTGGEKMLVISKAGYSTLTNAQESLIGKHYKTVITPEIPTIEYYGGGSARCMLLELY